MQPWGTQNERRHKSVCVPVTQAPLAHYPAPRVNREHGYAAHGGGFWSIAIAWDMTSAPTMPREIRPLRRPPNPPPWSKWNKDTAQQGVSDGSSIYRLWDGDRR